MAEVLFMGGQAELKTLSGGIGITALGMDALGVTPEVAAAGADVLVAGSAVFKGGSVQNPAAYGENMRAIRAAAEAARG